MGYYKRLSYEKSVELNERVADVLRRRQQMGLENHENAPDYDLRYSTLAAEFGVTRKVVEQRASRLKRGLMNVVATPCTCDENGPCGLPGHMDMWRQRAKYG